MKDYTSKLTVVKTFRLSVSLLEKIKAECEKRKLAFSQFIRKAVVAAVNREIF